MIDIQKFEDELDDLPTKMRDQRLVVIEKQKIVDEAKLKFNVANGMAIVAAKAPNATEKKAIAINLTKDEAMAIIEADYNLKKEEAGLTYLEDRFITARKILSIEQELIKSNLRGN